MCPLLFSMLIFMRCATDGIGTVRDFEDNSIVMDGCVVITQLVQVLKTDANDCHKRFFYCVLSTQLTSAVDNSIYLLCQYGVQFGNAVGGVEMRGY